MAVLALLGVLVAGGIGAVVLLGGGDDDDDEVVTAEATTTTVVDDVSTTVAGGEEPTETTVLDDDQMMDPQTIDDVAQSVVQIFAAADGVPLCTGSGTILTQDGLILTNAHVVENGGPCSYDSLQIAITTSADTAPVATYLGEVYAYDPALDLAVIGVATDLEGNPVTVSDLPAMAIGDSDDVGLGDTISILGYPTIGGDTVTFTAGSVSGFTAEAGIAERAWIKTDAAISGGNSGGLAVNNALEIVGVPTQASGGAELEVADCRVVTDTNGDGDINELDSCIPIGGFINGIRPINLARDLLLEARNRNIVDLTPDIVVAADNAIFTNVVMASAVENDIAVDNIVQLPSAAPQLCGTFDYEGLTDGVSWDAIWSVDGEFVEEFSILDSEWIGGPSGTSWWVCATGGETGLPDGVYELQLYIEGEFTASNTVSVGDQFTPVTVDFVNTTADTICFLRISPSTSNGWGPDELDATQTLGAGDTASVLLPIGQYDALAQDCDLNIQFEQFGIDVTGPGVINLTGG